MRRDGLTYRSLRRGRSAILNKSRGLTHVHPTAYIHRTARVEKDLRANSYVYVGPHCSLTSGVRIDRFTLLAHGVQILGNDHRFSVVGQPIIFAGRPPARETHIGVDAWIGANAIVMAGTRVGDGAIVGAGALVTRDIPPGEIWVGVPARHLRSRFEDAEDQARHFDLLARIQKPIEAYASARMKPVP